MSMKNPMTPAGIEPAPLRFLAQHLNYCSSIYLFIYSSQARFLKLCYEYQNRYASIDWKEEVFPAHVVNAYNGIKGKALLLPRLGTGWR